MLASEFSRRGIEGTERAHASRYPRLGRALQRTFDLVGEFHYRPAAQWDRMDHLIDELSAIVVELEALRGET